MPFKPSGNYSELLLWESSFSLSPTKFYHNTFLLAFDMFEYLLFEVHCKNINSHSKGEEQHLFRFSGFTHRSFFIMSGSTVDV